MEEVYELTKVIIKPYTFDYQLSKYDSQRAFMGAVVADNLRELAIKCFSDRVKISKDKGRLTTIERSFIDIESGKAFDSVSLEEMIYFYNCYLDTERYSINLQDKNI